MCINDKTPLNYEAVKRLILNILYLYYVMH